MTKHLHASPLTRLFFRIGIALLVVPLLALALYGQASYGSVPGTITDQSTAALSGATVTLTNVGTGEQHRPQSGAVAANAEVVITNSGTNVSVAGFVPSRETGLAIATDQTARVTDSSAVTNATDAQVINDVPSATQNPLFYAMLQNGVQLRNETSTSTLGDL
jgi:hypothetical protein